MRAKRLIVLVLLVATSHFYCSHSSRANKVYVSTLTGLVVRSGPSQADPSLAVLPFATEVIFLEERDPVLEIQGAYGRWTRVRYADSKEGWVFGAFLYGRAPEMYFRIEAVSGLKLRRTPGIQGEVMDVIARKTIGKVEEAQPRFETIDGKSGIWLKTTYNGKAGWIFSGFVTTASSAQGLETSDANVLDPGMGQLDLASKEEGEKLTRGKVVSTRESGEFKIVQVSYPGAPECESKGALYFQNKKTGKIYSSGFISEAVTSPSVLKDTVIATGGVCTCCCAGADTRMYFLEKDAVRYVRWMESDSTASCQWNMMYGLGHELFVENRVSQDGHLMIHRKQPHCELPAGMNLEDAARQGLRLTENKIFDHELFISIKEAEDRFDIHTYDKGIPEEYREVWGSARPMEK